MPKPSSRHLCPDCGRTLTDPISIKRHWGLTCHTAWLEERIAALESEVDTLRLVSRELKHIVEKGGSPTP